MRVLTAPDGRAFVLADRSIVQLSIRTAEDLAAFKDALDLAAFKDALAAATSRDDVKEAVAAIIVSIHHLE